MGKTYEIEKNYRRSYRLHRCGFNDAGNADFSEDNYQDLKKYLGGFAECCKYGGAAH